MSKKYKTVAELLEDPARWTQGASAKSAKGREVSLEGRAAVCWCLLGAIQKIHGNGDDDEFLDICKKVRAHVSPKFFSLADFNDKSDHRTVLKVVRKAGI